MAAKFMSPPLSETKELPTRLQHVFHGELYDLLYNTLEWAFTLRRVPNEVYPILEGGIQSPRFIFDVQLKRRRYLLGEINLDFHDLKGGVD